MFTASTCNTHNARKAQANARMKFRSKSCLKKNQRNHKTYMDIFDRNYDFVTKQSSFKGWKN